MASASLMLGLTQQQYHADPFSPPSLSASIAFSLVAKSPAHAWLEHPKLGGVRDEPTQAMDTGSLLHRLVLGAGADIEVIDADDWRSKAAREARDAARAAGRIPVLRQAAAEVEATAAAIRKRLDGFGITLAGEAEVAVAWKEQTTAGASVQCRGMLDHLSADRGTIYELKTTTRAHPRDCARRVVDMGYDIQAAAYLSAISKLNPSMVGRLDFVWLFAETAPPYCVLPARPSNAMWAMGEVRWQRAVDLWAKCLEADEWPGYVSEIATLEPPAWALAGDSEIVEALS